MAVSNELPIAIEVISGKDYYWCSCGRSKKQPFCDGSHSKTSFTPIKFVSDENKKREEEIDKSVKESQARKEKVKKPKGLKPKKRKKKQSK